MVHRRDGVRMTAIALALLLGGYAGAAAQAGGVISGRVVEAGTERPLGMVRVEVDGTALAAHTDSVGRFRLAVPVGVYAVRAVSIGHLAAVRTDVVVRPERSTVLEIRLSPSALALEAVQVRPSFFAPVQEGPVARLGFTAEEIRRAPGSAGDVSRILYGMPSVAKVDDQSNGLAVRGGTPAENLVLLDGIPVPNINHFAQQGSSGGAIGLLNVELIRDVAFQAGGFGAQYGDRMSSVMDITLRDGSADRRSGQVSLDMTGVGGVAEGPLGGSGTWIASVRRSYLDLLVETVDVGTSVAPRYGDYALRVATSPSRRHRFSALALWADDRFETDLEQALEHGMTAFGDLFLLQGTTGGTWTALWREGLLSRTTLSHTLSRFEEDYAETASRRPLLVNRSTEHAATLRHSTRMQMGTAASILLGGDVAWQGGRYDNIYHEHVNASGDTVAEVLLRERPRLLRGGVFLSATGEVVSGLSATAGVRADHNTLSGNTTVAPRLSASLALGERTTLGAAGGMYYQSLPLVMLAHEPHRSLDDPVAYHASVALASEVGEGRRLTVELYRKEYRRLPMDPADPTVMPLDEIVLGDRFTIREHMEATGRARASGVEAVLQQKLTGRVHGLLSGAWATSEYRDLDGRWRPRAFDNGVIVSGEGGWRASDRWELSARWIYAGGAPYTPLDEEASRLHNRTILDTGRTAAERYPAYHSLNVRADRRFFLRRSSIITYVSVWNAYDRANVASYYWHTEERAITPTHQWRVLPVFGVEWSF